MRFKLKISNNTNKAEKIKILYALNVQEKNFGLFDGITIELVNKEFDYKQLLCQLTTTSMQVIFLKSTNNRQLFFYQQDKWGYAKPIEPQLTIDRKPRPTKSYKEYFDEDVNDWVLGEKFKRKWNPTKWNIADTHESPIWSHSSFIELHLKRKQKFELEFAFIKFNNIFLII